MSQQGKNNRFLINFAKSLILLKNQSTEGLASKINIPHKNLVMFLSGAKMALPPEHAVKLFYQLGLGKNKAGKVGFQINCIHDFSLDLSGGGEGAQTILSTALSILPSYEARCVLKTRQYFYILIVSESVKISLRLKKPLFARLPVEKIGIKSLKDGSSKLIPAEYKKILTKGSLGILDFDAIYQQTYPNWDSIRSIANIHGIPYQDIVVYLKKEIQQIRAYSITEFQQSLQIEKGETTC
jgi:hypothetical protein